MIFSVLLSSLDSFLYKHDCGFHTLEYLAKWEGRLVPAVTAATVVELRKIYTWNWLTNEDFNQSGPEHTSSWRKLSRKSSISTSDHVALHTGRIPYILLPRNVRYYLFVLVKNYVCVLCYDYNPT